MLVSAAREKGHAQSLERSLPLVPRLIAPSLLSCVAALSLRQYVGRSVASRPPIPVQPLRSLRSLQAGVLFSQGCGLLRCCSPCCGAVAWCCGGGGVPLSVPLAAVLLAWCCRAACCRCGAAVLCCGCGFGCGGAVVLRCCGACYGAVLLRLWRLWLLFRGAVAAVVRARVVVGSLTLAL